MLNKLRALFFDIDDTLYSTTEFTLAARRAGIRAMIQFGLKMDEEALLKELLEIVDEFSSNDPLHFNKLLRRIPPQLMDGLNPNVLVACGIVAYQDVKYRELHPYEDVVEVMRLLSKQQGLKMGVISSGRPDKQYEKIVRMGLHKMLDPLAVFVAEEIGFSKTNARLYSRIAETLELKPGDCMMVGDRHDHDIDPAHQAGFKTVLNLRSGKHRDKAGQFAPDYQIHNFWDLMDILKRDYGLV